jgi:hypothetical protein
MKRKPSWFQITLLNTMLLYCGGLTAYRASRSLDDLTSVSGPVQQATYRLGGSRGNALTLLVQMSATAQPLQAYLGRDNEATRRRAQDLTQQLRTASSVTAYFTPDDAIPLLYQLKVDGQVLFSEKKAKVENLIFSAFCFLMLVVTDGALLWQRRNRQNTPVKKRNSKRTAVR